jgi:2-methylfumaryl-CoA hydratase
VSKSRDGNFFEDFELGQVIEHSTPRTVTTGDVSLYTALYGSRFAVQSSDAFAKAIAYPRSPIDDVLVFHVVFGKTVPDVSLNAVANLGYAECRFLKPVYPGDTLSSTSEVIGLRENSNRQSGVVYVRSTGRNQDGAPVLEFVRWVMVRKRNEAAPPPREHVPQLKKAVDAKELGAALPSLDIRAYNNALSGGSRRWGSYEVGEKIDHLEGITIEEAEHQLATRLYQNNSRVHFNQHEQAKGRFGRRLVYGGHIISIARAMSFNGLENAFHVGGINAGRHVSPAFAGDTVYAWSEVLEKVRLDRKDAGALRLRLVALKDKTASSFALKAGDQYDPAVLLDLDLWVLMPL